MYMYIYITYSQVLLFKVCRLLKEYQQQSKPDGCDSEFVKEMLLALLGALVLLPVNAAAAHTIWECLSLLPYLDRYQDLLGAAVRGVP